jgi:hypothetical protein
LISIFFFIFLIMIIILSGDSSGSDIRSVFVVEDGTESIFLNPLSDVFLVDISVDLVHSF